MKIDAHQHYWQISRGDYAWMDDSVAPIRRDHGPDDLDPLRRAAGIAGSVVIQAADSIAETRYLLGLAAVTPSILGVVGWVDLAAADAGRHLVALSHNPLFKGVRPMLQDIDWTEWVLQKQVLDNLAHLADLGLRMDALITPRHLPVIDELARQLPQLPIVIDHCAKPVFAKTRRMQADWLAGISSLAGHDSIMCKLSGLITEHGPGWNADTLRPAYRHVLDCFGAQRLMWGSDWPVLNLQGNYASWHDCAEQLTAGLNEDDRAAIFGGTAAQFYGLDPVTTG
ncbi:amidohydrolase family protein [Paracoccus seriniphilus]|uniref:amidohydrolase family protein n=1 Tax=Paracoccus seriniphilus TaxID=184748 RepID=UPI0035657901